MRHLVPAGISAASDGALFVAEAEYPAFTKICPGDTHKGCATGP